MPQFQVGDRVRIIPGTRYEDQGGGGSGVVYFVRDDDNDFFYDVEWDINGYTDIYTESDLELAPVKPKEPKGYARWIKHVESQFNT
jgi:hypothetical protein